MGSLVEIMGVGARLVLILLGVLSVWSVAIMIDRYFVFKKHIAKAPLEEPKALIRSGNWKDLESWAQKHPGLHGDMVRVVLDVNDGRSTEAYERAVASYLTERKLSLEKGFTFLATLASNAPFIGLFGTVLGIIEAFGILSSNANSGMNAVMWKLAEALVATAVGLLVAIPAVVAYNAYSQKIRNHFAECESIRDLFISRKV